MTRASGVGLYSPTKVVKMKVVSKFTPRAAFKHNILINQLMVCIPFMYLCLSVQECKHLCMETRNQHQVCSTIALHIIFWARTSLTLKLIDSARLAGWQSPGIYLSPP